MPDEDFQNDGPIDEDGGPIDEDGGPVNEDGEPGDYEGEERGVDEATQHADAPDAAEFDEGADYGNDAELEQEHGDAFDGPEGDDGDFGEEAPMDEGGEAYEEPVED